MCENCNDEEDLYQKIIDVGVIDLRINPCENDYFKVINCTWTDYVFDYGGFGEIKVLCKICNEIKNIDISA
jgi:hypothetical protein